MIINYEVLNPNAFQLLRFINDDTIRMIIMYGGSSSGKSFSCAQVNLLCTLFDGENTLVLRKVAASLGKTIYEDYKVAAKSLGIYEHFRFTDGLKRVKCLLNEGRIDFGGLDDPEKIKGISNYKRLHLEELSEFDSADLKQIRKRLRGKRGQKIEATFNPIKETHWIKREVLDAEQWHDVPMNVPIMGADMPDCLTAVKSLRMNAEKNILNPNTKEVEVHAPDTVLIQSTYLNNFWVVGSPDGRYGFYDEQCVADFEKDRLGDPDYYQVYALGEWGVLRTGSEFFGTFNRGVHCTDVAYNPDLPIHLSVDSNVLPYITITYWQAEIDDGVKLYQIGETCAENPNNTVRKAARLVCRRLHDIGCTDKVYIHGDASTRAANNIDDEKRSFHDLFMATLQADGFEVVDMVGGRNPSVAMSGEFINAVFDGQVSECSIAIGNECRQSIEDYLAVQKDANGAILKTKVKNKTTMQTYEEHGHISDTFRYVCVDLMHEQFTRFTNRRKRNLYAKEGALHFFNPMTECTYDMRVVYCIPNINGRMVIVCAARCGERWHILSACVVETSSTEELKNRITELQCDVNVIECADAYFPLVRDMRDSTGLNIRVLKESGDIDRRIAATSDYVRENVLFNNDKCNDDDEYASFMTSLLDYGRDSQSKEASTALSGLVQYIEKSF